MRAEIIRRSAIGALYDREMHLRRAAPVVMTLALMMTGTVITGCGHTERVGGDRTLRVALTEYRLNPQRASVSAGTLTIIVHNFGRLTHNLSLTRGGQSAGSTKPIAPGESAQLTVTLAPGSYVMASTILDDQALGEYGSLQVTS